jgi:hypothetical protein
VSDQNNGNNEDSTVHKDGFELTFYPGFARACEVTDADGETFHLYEQKEPYKLPPGHRRPRTRHKLRLKGGKRHQDITLDIRDPELRIAKITVELYGEDYHEDGQTRQVMQTMNVPNNPNVCPPQCT